SGIKQVVPMSPTASSNRLICLISCLYRHIWNQPLSLPTGKILAHQFVHFTLASEVLVAHGRKERRLPDLAQGLPSNPLNTVESFLKNVVRAWREIRFLP